MNILIIGGTRNLGHLLTCRLLESGHRVTIFNRGRTPDTLPEAVERLRGDRSDPAQVRAALAGRTFEAVVDTTLYNGSDATAVVDLLAGRVGHYIFLSTGQVYLVRLDVPRPAKEEDYAGPVMAAPAPDTHDYAEWRYGIEKRQAEDVLTAVWERDRFPFTTLRLPMVNSERDHFDRIYGYLLRLQDGGPILVPDRPGLPTRHVYGADVITAIVLLLETGGGKGRAFNISQDETLSLEDFLALLASTAGRSLQIARIAPDILEAYKLMPACSPFSESWMSELDNRRSKRELGLRYTPLATYLQKIVAHYQAHPRPVPETYRRRDVELKLVG